MIVNICNKEIKVGIIIITLYLVRTYIHDQLKIKLFFVNNSEKILISSKIAENVTQKENTKH